MEGKKKKRCFSQHCLVIVSVSHSLDHGFGSIYLSYTAGNLSEPWHRKRWPPSVQKVWPRSQGCSNPQAAGFALLAGHDIWTAGQERSSTWRRRLTSPGMLMRRAGFPQVLMNESWAAECHDGEKILSLKNLGICFEQEPPLPIRGGGTLGQSHLGRRLVHRGARLWQERGHLWERW